MGYPRPHGICSVVLFTKAPIPGLVKTRLSPPLSLDTCADLQRAFISDIIEKLRQVDAVLRIYFAPDEGQAYFAGIPAEAVSQGDGDLGERMLRCLNRELSMGMKKVLLVGADIPELSPDDLRYGYQLLDSADVVLGPAHDGGFYCIGTRSELPTDLLEGIPWSGPEALNLTEHRVQGLGLRTARMTPHLDVDDYADLGAVRPDRTGPATRRILKRIRDGASP